ncbi:MAG: hypothetical protein AMXMBFR48_14320 [Ignavibacteriales bacterium]
MNALSLRIFSFKAEMSKGYPQKFDKNLFLDDPKNKKFTSSDEKKPQIFGKNSENLPDLHCNYSCE